MAESVIVMDGGQDFVLITDAPTTDAFVITSGGPQGDVGPQGPRGYSILNGTGVPTGATGVGGDFYIDTTTNTFYGPKAAGAWGVGIKLDGRTILNGTGVPAPSLGDDGDIYLDVTNNLFYGPKDAGAWGSGQPFIGSVFTYVQPNEPAAAPVGSLWIDTDDTITSEAVLPVGGTTGQFLTKTSPTDYATGWTTVDLNVYDKVRPLDVRPVSPHVKDDEFDGPALDAKWTAGLRAFGTTFSQGWLTMSPQSSGFAHFLRQNAPAGVAGTGAFSISCKISSPSGITTADVRPGIFMARSGSTKSIVCGLGLSGGPAKAMWIEHNNYSDTGDWGAYNGSWSSNQGGTYAGGSMWFKMSWDGAGNITMYYSTNGITWYQFATRGGWLQPDRIGVVIENNSGNTTTADVVSYDWFRVTEP